MRRHLIASIFSIALLAAAVPGSLYNAYGAPLTSVDITASNPDNGQEASYFITFGTTSDKGRFIEVTFPAGFDVTAAKVTDVVNLPAGKNTVIIGQVVSYNTGKNLAAGTFVSLQIMQLPIHTHSLLQQRMLPWLL